MTDQIVSRAQMRARGRAAFADGRGRDEHGMNLGAPAVAEWHEGWDSANAERIAELKAARAARYRPCA